MPTESLPYSQTGYFSSLICDYLDRKEILKPFYHRTPDWEHFSAQAKEKSGSFNTAARTVLRDRVDAQCAGLELSKATQNNIKELESANTFTVTTGHQLNLFTGPLYFLYKIFTVINLAESLNKRYPEFKVVPVFWMATEDHDFEEINFFKFGHRKISWDGDSGGAVGRISTTAMDEVFNEAASFFGNNKRAETLKDMFQKAYLEHNTLAEATRYLVNRLFGRYGLVIVDGDDRELKKHFSPVVKQELLDQKAYQLIEKSTSQLEAAGYPKQVHPREINLFYLSEHGRHRIIRQGDDFYLNETNTVFTREEILQQLEQEPQRFSPNALLRPLYQEVVLPNLCYVGGGGELAYWFQLKECFKAFSVPFPVLLLRNSALIISKKEKDKLARMGRTIRELFNPTPALEELHTRDISGIEIDLEPQRLHLQKQFEDLYRIAEQTDPSFVGAVAAQEKKQLNGLDKLEKRLLKAQKRKLSDQLERLTSIQSDLFPNGSLQERHDNFSTYYLEYGAEMFERLQLDLQPLEQEFTVLCW